MNRDAGIYIQVDDMWYKVELIDIVSKIVEFYNHHVDEYIEVPFDQNLVLKFK